MEDRFKSVLHTVVRAIIDLKHRPELAAAWVFFLGGACSILILLIVREPAPDKPPEPAPEPVFPETSSDQILEPFFSDLSLDTSPVESIPEEIWPEETITEESEPEEIKPIDSKTEARKRKSVAKVLERPVFSTKYCEAPELHDYHMPFFEKVDAPEFVEIRFKTFSEAYPSTALYPPRAERGIISYTYLGGLKLQNLRRTGIGINGAWGSRDGGGRRNAVFASGGSPGSENAVELGLKWLHDHQESDGRWDCGKYGGHSKDSHNVAVTGLALSAFLGAGYIEKGGGNNPAFRNTVKKGLDWLQSNQGETGGFSNNNYAHGMATLAVCEAYGMSNTRKDMAQRAVDHMISQQKPGGGWDYGDKGGDRNRNDTSITAWQVWALQSAKLAGLNVPPSSFTGARRHFTKAINSEPPKLGTVAYAIEDGKKVSGGLAITALTMKGLLSMGRQPKNPFMIRGADQLSVAGPQVKERLNLYYLYFATYTMFNLGGDYWKKWNQGMRDPLVSLQNREAFDDLGSFDPSNDAYGEDGGRVYTTALSVMCLEVYYRYKR